MADSISLRVSMPTSQVEAGYGRARLDSEARSALKLSVGDTVEIIGKRSVVAKVFKSPVEDEGMGLIRIDGLTRTNAGVALDDTVTVRRCEPAAAKTVALHPDYETEDPERFSGILGIIMSGLVGRPLLEGMDIVIPNIDLMGNRTTFKVSYTSPKGPVLVTEGTKITIDRSGGKEEGRPKTPGKRVTYDDIGGLDDALRRVREIIELPLKHPELFDRMGITPPRGVLLYGPPGTGKTLLAEAVASESGASLFSIRGPEIIGKFYGQSEERLRDVFDEAEKAAPSIIFLDEIDSLAPARDDNTAEAEHRLVAQLLTLMDGMGGRGNVIVIGATNREDSIDPALRRPGRFDREIEIGVPGRKARQSILGVHVRGMPLFDDVSVEELASLTQGFVGADLAALCREAAMKCLSRRIPELELDRPVPREVLETMRVTMADFRDALSEIEPSGMREVMVEIPKVTWDDIGGLDDVRASFDEVIVPEGGNSAFDRLGISPGRGILLYGPPGTGKTLIAKAVANGVGYNFISVSGPEVVNKWIGESEKAIRQIFKRAKQLAPCIVFFDEIDSIAPARGADDGSKGTERIVAQLLTSIDGVENLRNVTVMAATNRPDMVDPALLRPGRLDRQILVGKPDAAARRAILEIHTRRMPLDGVDLDEMVSRTDGYVGADLEMICREAGLAAYREDREAAKVTMAHFLKALSEVPPSVSQAQFDFYDGYGRDAKKRRTSWDKTPFYG